jgi:transposase
MHPEAEEELKVRLALVVLELAEYIGVVKACKEFEIPRSTFYRWKQKYEQQGPAGLYRKKPVAQNSPRKLLQIVIEKILELRTDQQLGALRIKYYLDRYHGIKISESTVS